MQIIPLIVVVTACAVSLLVYASERNRARLLKNACKPHSSVTWNWAILE